MSEVSDRYFGRRAQAAGILAAGTNVPLTLQRTLMPRGTVDQAIVTGLSISTNQALVTLIQESVQAGTVVALRRAIRRRGVSPGRAVVAGDVAVFGAGLAVQRALARRHGEPLARAGGRTAGFWLSASGAMGAVVGGLDESFGLRRRGSRAAVPALLATTGALAGVGEWSRRRRALLDRDLPEEDVRASTARALAFGVGVSAGTSLFAAGERRAANALARSLAKVLPGEEALWRPVGHALSFGALVALGRFATQRTFARIEAGQGAVETAFDIRPPSPLVSGSVESEVAFETMSVQGRRFVWMTTPADVMEKVTGEPPVVQPIRAYVGLDSASSERERVDLALRELDRTGAFDRSWLMVVSPTGTGYVNYAAVQAFELLTRGDCATVAMQYAARPSVLSLSRVDEGREHFRLLLEGIKARLANRPKDQRPKVVVFGESLGAWTSQDPFVDKGTEGLVDAGVDYAIWIGTPHFSKWKEQVLRDTRPEVDRSIVGVFNSIDDWNACDAATRARIRYVMITHHDDGVAVFGPELAIQSPDWLGAPGSRPPTVPKGMRWMPTTTFFQVLVDMKNSATVVPGVFAAKGHDYRADLLPFFNAVLGFDLPSERLQAINAWLEWREKMRTEWVSEHGDAARSLSASVLERMIQRARAEGRDTDSELINIIREVILHEEGAHSPLTSG